MASTDEKTSADINHRESNAAADTKVKTVAAQGVALADGRVLGHRVEAVTLIAI